jgi:hypothetical protein
LSLFALKPYTIASNINLYNHPKFIMSAGRGDQASMLCNMFASQVAKHVKDLEKLSRIPRVIGGGPPEATLSSVQCCGILAGLSRDDVAIPNADSIIK